MGIVGAGHVGLVTGCCLAHLGHLIRFVDIDESRLEEIGKGRSPFIEPGLESILIEAIKRGAIECSVSFDVVKECDLVLICAPTPIGDQGNHDLSHLRSAVGSVVEQFKSDSRWPKIVIRSTVPPGTTRMLQTEASHQVGEEIRLIFNPEFLREGSAVSDFASPDRCIIGVDVNEDAATLLEALDQINCPKLIMGIEEAEMVKLASNAFLATKISLMNEIGNLCKQLGIDSHQVAAGIGGDQRLGPQFLRPGLGFGGSCFQKDVQSLAQLSSRHGISPRLLNATLEVNEGQVDRAISVISVGESLVNRHIAVLGLSFKPGTDDIRGSRSIELVRKLVSEGALVTVHDPVSGAAFSELGIRAVFHDKISSCIEQAEKIVIATEWEEYNDPTLYGERLVIDCRGITPTSNYTGLCW